jgi:hypothetical protein
MQDTMTKNRFEWLSKAFNVGSPNAAMATFGKRNSYNYTKHMS